jgi:TM2 domain-containing membrane protein YozV
MFCRNCAKEVPVQAVMCVGCGSPPRSGDKHCWNCACETPASAMACVKCGVSLAPPLQPPAPGAKSKLVAGLLGIFVGGLGIHRFYLGYIGIGVVQLLLCTVGGILTCGILSGVAGLWGLIEGILLLVGSMDRDAKGQLLRD